MKNYFASFAFAATVLSGFLILPPVVLATPPAPPAPVVTMSCVANPINVHASSTCTTYVTGNGHDSLNNITVTYYHSGTGSFSYSATHCHLAGNDHSGSCSLIYTPSAVGTGAHTITGHFEGNSHYGATSTSATLTVNKLNLTTSGITASNKTYDGTATASVNTASVALVGIHAGDTVTLNTSGVVGNFSDKNVGAGKTVTISGLTLGGSSAGNYNLVQPTVTADITLKTIGVNGLRVVNKVYDGGVLATLDASLAALDGVIAGDGAALDATSASAVFADKSVGVGKAVAVSGLLVSGADAANYSLTQPALTADISQKTLTVTATALNKVYDGSTFATVNLFNDKLAGDEVNVSGSGAFGDPNVGAGKTVAVSGIAIVGGADSSNYVLGNTTTEATANISEASAVISLDRTNLSRVYSGVGQEVPVLSTEPADLPYTVTYNGKTELPVGVGSYSVIASVSNPNYAGSDNATLDITPSSLSITGGLLVPNKVYDGTPDVVGLIDFSSPIFAGLFGSDTVSLIGPATGVFADKNVGVGKAVTVSGLLLGGDLSINYNLAQPMALADITPRELTISGASAESRVYDGTAVATIGTSTAVLSGVLEGDDISLDGSAVSGVFADKNAGVEKLVTFSGFIIGGADQANYALTQPTTIADILKRALTVTADSQSKNYGAIDPALSYQITSGSVVDGDNFSGSLARALGESVGVYAINLGELSLGSNYEMTFVPANLTIGIGAESSSIVMSTTTSEGGSVNSSIPADTERVLDADGVTVTVNIPAGTTISGPATWDGTFAMPAFTSTGVQPSPDYGFTASPITTISIGVPDVLLTFDRAVRINFDGQANKLVGWSRDGVFTKIENVCVEDSQTAGDALSDGADCHINVDGGLVVWTKHFTNYTTYTQTAIPPVQLNGAKFGGGAVPNAPVVVVPPAPVNQTPGNVTNNTPSTPVHSGNQNSGSTPGHAVATRPNVTGPTAPTAPKNGTQNVKLATGNGIPLQAAVGQIGSSTPVKVQSVFQRIWNWLFKWKK